MLELRLHPYVRAGTLSEDELYERLPAGTREVINRFKFADFIQRLRDAGYATPDAPVTLLDPDCPPIRFSWR